MSLSAIAALEHGAAKRWCSSVPPQSTQRYAAPLRAQIRNLHLQSSRRPVEPRFARGSELPRDLYTAKDAILRFARGPDVALVSEFAPFRADQNAGGWALDSSWRAPLRACGLEYARERARGKA